MDEGKAAIYNYIRDQHDKHLAHRENLASQFANIRLTAGLILTVFSFSLNLVIRSLEIANGRIALALAMLPLAFFAVALWFVTRSLLNIPNLVGTVRVYFPAVNRTKINKVLGLELDADQVIEDLSQNYLDAIELNTGAKRDAGEKLRRCVRFVRWALFATMAFLVSTLLSNIIAGWLFRNH